MCGPAWFLGQCQGDEDMRKEMGAATFTIRQVMDHLRCIEETLTNKGAMHRPFREFGMYIDDVRVLIRAEYARPDTQLVIAKPPTGGSI